MALNRRSSDIYDAMEMQPPVQNDTVLENSAANGDGLPEGGISNPLYHPVQVFNDKGNILMP